MNLIKKLERSLAYYNQTLTPRTAVGWLRFSGVGKSTLNALKENGLVIPDPIEEPQLGPPPGLFEYHSRIKRLQERISKHQAWIDKWKKELAEMRAWTVNSR